MGSIDKVSVCPRCGTQGGEETFVVTIGIRGSQGWNSGICEKCGYSFDESPYRFPNHNHYLLIECNNIVMIDGVIQREWMNTTTRKLFKILGHKVGR